jgi:hypothetical protein
MEKVQFCTFLNYHFPSKRSKESKFHKKIKVCSATCPKELKKGSKKPSKSSKFHESSNSTSKCRKSSTLLPICTFLNNHFPSNRSKESIFLKKIYFVQKRVQKYSKKVWRSPIKVQIFTGVQKAPQNAKKLNFCTFLNNHFPSKRLKESKFDKKIEVCSATCPKELKNGSIKLNMN